MRFLLPFLVKITLGKDLVQQSVGKDAILLSSNASFVVNGINFVTGCLPSWPEFEKTGNV
jgi:hypothetical protein